MKKLSVFLGVLIILLPAAAQTGLSVNAGISIPIMCYASVNPENPDAGFARTGLTIDISYTHPFNAYTGIKTILYYSSNPAGNNLVPATGSFRMAGLMAGPALTTNNQRKWQGFFSPLAGYSRVWTPQLQRQNQPWLYQQAAGCFSWGGEIGLRYRINEKSFIQFGAGHLNMKPKLDGRNTASAKTEQHIVTVSGRAGIGW